MQTEPEGPLHRANRSFAPPAAVMDSGLPGTGEAPRRGGPSRDPRVPDRTTGPSRRPESLDRPPRTDRPLHAPHTKHAYTPPGGHVEVERFRAALRRHRWCCDNGMPRRPGRSGIRAGFRRLARPGIRAASRLVPRRQGRRGEGRRARAAPGVRAPEAVQRPARLAHTRVSGSLVSSAVRAGRVFGPVGPHRRTAGF